MAERRRILRESREVHSADEVLHFARETRRREVEEVMAWVFEGGLTLAPMQPSVVACVAPGIAGDCCSLASSPAKNARSRTPQGRAHQRTKLAGTSKCCGKLFYIHSR